MRIDGVAAVVTGGASGLGEATVRRLTAAGARVTIADLDANRGKAIVDELGPSASFAETDVTDPDQVQAAVDTASAAGPLRICVSCAGAGKGMRLVGKDGSPHDLDAFVRTITTYLIGTFNVMRLAAARMATTDPLDDDGERGVVVNTASVAAFEGQIGQVAYSAAKGGVVGMTLPAARDLAVLGIRVVSIAPGTFYTPAWRVPEESLQGWAQHIPFPRRLGRPAEYAALVQHICENVMLNGEVIRLDGALRMPPK